MHYNLMIKMQWTLLHVLIQMRMFYGYWVVLMNIYASRKFCLLGNYTVKEKVKAKPTLAISVLSND